MKSFKLTFILFISTFALTTTSRILTGSNVLDTNVTKKDNAIKNAMATKMIVELTKPVLHDKIILDVNKSQKHVTRDIKSKKSSHNSSSSSNSSSNTNSKRRTEEQRDHSHHKSHASHTSSHSSHNQIMDKVQVKVANMLDSKARTEEQRDHSHHKSHASHTSSHSSHNHHDESSTMMDKLKENLKEQVQNKIKEIDNKNTSQVLDIDEDEAQIITKNSKEAGTSRESVKNMTIFTGIIVAAIAL